MKKPAKASRQQDDRTVELHKKLDLILQSAKYSEIFARVLDESSTAPAP
jgi:hypothetical protein